jgi:ABC-type transport system involved in cytochrome bd biosynthesis fused ATPase/permease subunit
MRLALKMVLPVVVLMVVAMVVAVVVAMVVVVAVVAAGNSRQVVLPTMPMEKMDQMPHQQEAVNESAEGEYRSRVRRLLLACVSDILVKRDRRSKIAEVLSAGSRLSATDLRDIRGN